MPQLAAEEAERKARRRFCNISHIMNLRGRKWITGLLPLSNVGPNVQPRLEAMLDRLEGKSHLS